MKRLSLIFTVIMFVAGTAWASGENVVGVDLAPLFRGFSFIEKKLDTSGFGIGTYYERQISERITIGGQFNYISLTVKDNPDEVKISIFSISARGRMYPLEPMEKLFFGAGIGFDRISLKYKEPGYSESDAVSGLSLSVNTGYRLMLNNHFFVEPLVGYKISKVGSILAIFEVPADIAGMSGWHVDLTIGYRF